MILTISDNTKFSNRIQLLCQDDGHTVVNISELLSLDKAIEEHAPDAIVVGPSIPVSVALEKAAQVFAVHPEVPVVIAVDMLTPEALRDAMRAGVKDVIEQSASDEQVRSSISHALEISRRFKGSFDKSADAPEVSESSKSGVVITFFSTKGGVGKTFISANAAVALAKSTGKRVVILDLDLQFGDIGIMFQMVPDRTIYDVTEVMEHLDADMLQGFLSTHSSGIKALLAPVRPHESESIKPFHVKDIINLLKAHFDYVVIDTPPAFTDAILTALDESDRIYLIATMDLPSVKNVKLAIQTLKQLGYPPETIKFILNRSDSKVWLDVREMEDSIGLKPEVKIPSDRIVPRSVNKGTPLVIEQPKSSVGKSLFELADKVKDTQAKVSAQLSESGYDANEILRGLS